MLSAIGSQLTYSAILRLLTILEKKVFRICPVVTGADPREQGGGGGGGDGVASHPPDEKKIKKVGFPQTLS